jgi:hypothetical protein
MRFITVLFAYLVVTGWLLVSWPASGTSAGISPWRRTAHGWESVERWPRGTPTPKSSLQPLLLAAFEVGVSTLALMAGSDWQKRHNPANS